MNETLKRLYEQHAAALRLYARTWCRSPDDALQEAMIELSRQPLLPPEPVAWLYRTVRFRAINHYRGEQRRQNRERAAADQREPFFVQDQDNAIEAADVEKALRRLPDQNREIVIARIWGGLSFEQIAKLTSLSSSTAHRNYRASLEELKQYLDEANRPLPVKRNLS